MVLDHDRTLAGVRTVSSSPRKTHLLVSSSEPGNGPSEHGVEEHLDFSLLGSTS
jgi:hypothetical protein